MIYLNLFDNIRFFFNFQHIRKAMFHRLPKSLCLLIFWQFLPLSQFNLMIHLNLFDNIGFFLFHLQYFWSLSLFLHRQELG